MSKEPPSLWSGHMKMNGIDTQVRYRPRSDGMVRVDGWAVHVSQGYVKEVRVYQYVGRELRSKKIWTFSDKRSSKSVVDLGVNVFPYLVNQYPSRALIQVWTTNNTYASAVHDIG